MPIGRASTIVLILCAGFLLIAAWFGYTLLESDHCRKDKLIKMNEIHIQVLHTKIGNRERVIEYIPNMLTWTINILAPMNRRLRHEAITPTIRQTLFSLTTLGNNLLIKGPVIDEFDTNEYYDVSFPGDWFDYSSMIVKHWQSTLPEGIQPVYNYRDPQIFFHGRKSNPYNQFKRKGYWMDDYRQQLWTVALTNKMYAIKWVFTESTQSIAYGIGYVVVYKFKHEHHKQCIIRKLNWNDPEWSRQTNYIKARYKFYHVDTICEASKYPDAYVFSRTAQKGNCPLQIARVYRIHFKNYI